jgi:ferredoxin
MINRSDADMVELNFGCYGMGAIHPQTGEFVLGGMGIYPEIVERWTRFCDERIKMPIGSKLPAYAPDPLASALACIRGGSRCIQYADSFRIMSAIPPLVINPDTLEVGIWPGLPHSQPSCAPWVVPFIDGVIANFRLNGITIDISGCGGVRGPLDVIRHLMAGATSVQICTATLVEGVAVGEEYLTDITTWMEAHNYESIKDIQGIVVDKEKLRTDPTKFTPGEIPQVMGGVIPSLQVAPNKKCCISCGWCIECCPHLAVRIENKHPVVDQHLCEVCGLCVAVCPMEALSIQPRCADNSSECTEP